MLMAVDELSRPGFLLGHASLLDVIIDQGYALRAFSCKGHLLWLSLALTALFFREPRPREAVHAFWNQFGLDA